MDVDLLQDIRRPLYHENKTVVGEQNYRLSSSFTGRERKTGERTDEQGGMAHVVPHEAGTSVASNWLPKEAIMPWSHSNEEREEYMPREF